MNKNVLIFTSIDTTSLDYNTGSIISLASRAISINDKEDIVEPFNVKMSYWRDNEIISKESSIINGYTDDQIRAFEYPENQFIAYVRWLLKIREKVNSSNEFLFTCFSNNFCENYMRNFFTIFGKKMIKYNSFFKSKSFDITSLILFYLIKTNKLEDISNFKLLDIYRYLFDNKVNIEKRTSLENVNILVDIFCKINENLERGFIQK